MPKYQKLLSSYDISQLEIKALENDNRILNKKLKEISQENINFLKKDRKMRRKFTQMKLDKLEIQKTVEEIRMVMQKQGVQLEDVKRKLRDSETKLERMTNRLSIDE